MKGWYFLFDPPVCVILDATTYSRKSMGSIGYSMIIVRNILTKIVTKYFCKHRVINLVFSVCLFGAYREIIDFSFLFLINNFIFCVHTRDTRK